MASYLDQALSKIEHFEGAIPWMYRDTVGKVTVAVGLMLPDAGAAQHLPFEGSGRAATADEIAAEFRRVDALPMGRPATFYRAPGKPELPPDAMSALLRRVLSGFEGELRQAVAGYDALPDSVKMALLDMAYNLGPQGLLHGYPRLLQAVRTGDWNQAAQNCERRGPGRERNEWTRQMFLANVLGKLEGAAESFVKQLGYGLLGAGATLWERLRRVRR